MVEATKFTTWGDITKESEEMQIEALRKLTRAKKEMYGEGISFPLVFTLDETTPHRVIFVPLTKREIYRRERRDRRQKENAQDAKIS